MLSERLDDTAKRMKESASVWDNWESGSWQALATEVVKLERVARAARDVSNDPCLLVHESCLLFDGTNDSCPACRLLAALADLPEDALK